jgi:aryl-alcohol dehydrogenase-like predicted oxidoreductase
MLGIGDVADRALSIEKCAAVVRRAMDAGLNLVDTAPSYEDGYSERVVGRALRGRRAGMFLVDKIDHFDRPVATQLEDSFRRLRVDMVDAFVFHGVSKMPDWFRIAAPRGGMDQLQKWVRRDRVRFRGVSTHNPEVARAAILSGMCDIILFAVGPFCDPRYTRDILPLARKHGVGTVCFKTFGAGKLLGDTTGYGRPLKCSGPRASTPATTPRLPRLNVADCVHYTLTCDPDVALLGMSTPEEQNAAFAAAAAFRPLPPRAMTAIRRRAAVAVRGKDPCWWNPQ